MDLHSDFPGLINEQKIVKELEEELKDSSFSEDRIRNSVNMVANIHRKSLSNNDHLDFIKRHAKEYLTCEPLQRFSDSLSSLNF